MRHLLAYLADTVSQWMLDTLDALFPGPADDLMALVYATAETTVDTRPNAIIYDLSWPVPDHVACEGEDCERTICDCDTVVPCPTTVSRGCLHHNALCDECRPNCSECMDDAAYDAGRW
jgi:hypothetical protein